MRVFSVPGGKSGLMASIVGLPRSVCSLPSAATSVTPWSRAKFAARCVALMIVRCSSCSSGESAGLSAQLYSHGSVKKLMLTTSMP